MAEQTQPLWLQMNTDSEKEKFLIKLLQHYKFALSNEIACQDSIEAKLRHHQIPFEREVKLGTHGIIDFVIENRIGVEVKIKGQRMPIYRQCRRYCQSGKISTLILATMYPMELPEIIDGVRSLAVSMTSAQLKRIV